MHHNCSTGFHYLLYKTIGRLAHNRMQPHIFGRDLLNFRIEHVLVLDSIYFLVFSKAVILRWDRFSWNPIFWLTQLVVTLFAYFRVYKWALLYYFVTLSWWIGAKMFFGVDIMQRENGTKASSPIMPFDKKKRHTAQIKHSRKREILFALCISTNLISYSIGAEFYFFFFSILILIVALITLCVRPPFIALNLNNNNQC